MKTKLTIILSAVLLLVGCKASFPVAQESGKEDIAYLLFVGQKEYGGKEVEVTIDGNKSFTANVVKARKSNRRGTQYAIGVGTRSIKVTSNGQILYQKKIFVSTQEVKQILLP